MDKNLSTTPQISVVMGVYNGEKYLSRAISSVLEQTFTDFEFIIINDGSTDHSPEIIRNFNDPRIRLLEQENKGLVASLNRGFEEARAPLIARIDADDICFKDRLEIQKSFMDNHPEVVVAGSAFELIDDREATLEIFNPMPDDIHIRRELFLRNPFGHGTIMMRKQAFETAGGYSDVGPVEDYDLWLRMAPLGKLGNLQSTLYKWRVNLEGISQKNTADQTERMKRLLKQSWEKLPFPNLSWRQILADGRKYRETERWDVYIQYLYDQYALSLALAKKGRFQMALVNLLAVMRLDPKRSYFLLRIYKHRAEYGIN